MSSWRGGKFEQKMRGLTGRESPKKSARNWAEIIKNIALISFNQQEGILKPAKSGEISAKKYGLHQYDGAEPPTNLSRNPKKL